MAAASVRRYWRHLTALGCAVCRGPAIVHHVLAGSVKHLGHKGMGQKNSDLATIPLCPRHHNGDDGIHTLGVETWERRYGTQLAMLEWVEAELGVPIIGQLLELKSVGPFPRVEIDDDTAAPNLVPRDALSGVAALGASAARLDADDSGAPRAVEPPSV